MAKMNSFPFQEHLLQLKEGEETIIIILGQPFVISKATEDDIERIGKGYYCLD
jgi:hypothetical protein